MKLLALDTATEACSAALLVDGRLLSRYSEPERGHAELILPMVDELLVESGLKLVDLDCVAVGRGPGAFTGIRIGVSVAQGLAFGANLPVVPVSDLAALAQRAVEACGVPAVVACIDARMGEVYWGAFKAGPGGLVMPYIEESVSPPEAVSVDWEEEWMAAGSGWTTYPEMAQRAARRSPVNMDGTLLPRAAEIARLAERDYLEGKAVAPEEAQPVYLRDRVAWAGSRRK